ncbi:hypothetical protein NC661_05685 [Aquibacillus koreensis]|uniref:Uncharacterized protein n=1 Tax=Aquibacillus koreensis TaxID=279446 RepID=A0A9X4AH85_9BACI|nr:hypothetical protein [Aquibacillus koreensis]MCT2537160.1 hypothetical protein [Aquibacillus koreensis]MDC3419857.1 hypothetical protein [Aquibacillus koreensis]
MTEKFTKDNFVGRLYDVLNNGFIDDRFINDNKQLKDIIVESFELPTEENLTLVLEKQIDIIILIQRAKKQVQSLEGYDSPIFLEPLDYILTRFLSTNIDTYISKLGITQEKVEPLKMISLVVSNIAGENLINNEELESLISKIEDLKKDLSNSSLPLELRSAIIKNLSNIDSAIYNYKLFGNQDLNDSLEQSLGMLMVRINEVKEHADDSSLKKFFHILSHISSLVTISGGVTALNEHVLPLLIQ